MAAKYEPKRLGRALALIAAGYVTVNDGFATVRSSSGDSIAYTFAVDGVCPCEDAQKGNVCKHKLAAFGKERIEAFVAKKDKTFQAIVAQAQKDEAKHINRWIPQVAHIRGKKGALIVLAGGETVPEADFAFSGRGAAFNALVNAMGTSYYVVLRASSSNPVHALDEIQGLVQ